MVDYNKSDDIPALVRLPNLILQLENSFSSDAVENKVVVSFLVKSSIASRHGSYRSLPLHAHSQPEGHRSSLEQIIGSIDFCAEGCVDVTFDGRISYVTYCPRRHHRNRFPRRNSSVVR